MGRPKKSVLESDSSEQETESQQKPPTRRMVEAKHTIQYLEPVPLPLLDQPDEEEEITATDEPELDEIEYDEAPRRRSTALSFRAKLKKELSDRGIGGAEQLRLKVERLPLYSMNGQTGVNAAKEFVRSFPCQKEWIFSDEYLEEVSKSCGPGAYWMTLRHKNTIVKTWDIQISGPPVPASTPVANGDTPAATPAVTSTYPTSQFPPQPLPTPQRTFKQELKEFVETQRMMKELSSGAPAEPTPITPADPEVTLLTVLARDESVMDKLSKGLLGKILGKTAEDRNEWAEVAMEMVKSGQAPQIISSTINAFFNGFSNLIPKGANNGSTQMADKAQQTSQGPDRQQPQLRQDAQIQTEQESTQGMEQSVGSGIQDHHAEHNKNIAPEDHLLALVLDQCARRVPPRVVLGRILRFADEINAQAPAQTVDDYLDMFVEIDPAVALEFIKTRVPGGEQVTSLPHALEWTTELQRLLKEALTPDETEDHS